MDDKVKPPRQVGRLTSDRVAGMSDEARAEVARNLAGRPAPVPHTPHRRLVSVTDSPVRVAADSPDAAAEAIRLAADLQRTERRLQSLERSFTRSRYQMGDGGPPTGRYARLLRRADRLERQLRSLS